MKPLGGHGTFIGVKLIQAKPMNLGDYNEYKGWTIPEAEDPKREGYLVKYSDEYVSWSPKEVFESAYFEIENENSISNADVTGFSGMFLKDPDLEDTAIITGLLRLVLEWAKKGLKK